MATEGELVEQLVVDEEGSVLEAVEVVETQFTISYPTPGRHGDILVSVELDRDPRNVLMKILQTEANPKADESFITHFNSVSYRYGRLLLNEETADAKTKESIAKSKQMAEYAMWKLLARVRPDDITVLELKEEEKSEIPLSRQSGEWAIDINGGTPNPKAAGIEAILDEADAAGALENAADLEADDEELEDLPIAVFAQTDTSTTRAVVVDVEGDEAVSFVSSTDGDSDASTEETAEAVEEETEEQRQARIAEYYRLAEDPGNWGKLLVGDKYMDWSKPDPEAVKAVSEAKERRDKKREEEAEMVKASETVVNIEENVQTTIHFRSARAREIQEKNLRKTLKWERDDMSFVRGALKEFSRRLTEGAKIKKTYTPNTTVAKPTVKASNSK